jgi:hypothetical protein
MAIAKSTWVIDVLLPFGGLAQREIEAETAAEALYRVTDDIAAPVVPAIAPGTPASLAPAPVRGTPNPRTVRVASVPKGH